MSRLPIALRWLVYFLAVFGPVLAHFALVFVWQPLKLAEFFPSTISPALDTATDLAGQWKYYPYDDLNIRKLVFQSKQPALILKVPGTLLSQGITIKTTMGWYRRTFTLSPQRYLQPSLMIGPVHFADEVYLNGQLIGGIGNLNSHSVMQKNPGNLNRLYRFDPGLLSASGNNIVAIRLANQMRGVGGIAYGPVQIGEYHALKKVAEAGNFQRIIIDMMNIGFISLLWIGWLIVAIFLPKAGPELASLGVMIASFTVVRYFDSIALTSLGIHLPGSAVIVVTMFAILPLVTLHYGIQLFHLRPRRKWLLVELLLALIALFVLLQSIWPSSVSLVYLSKVLAFVSVTGTAVTLAAIAISRIGRKEAGSYLIAMGFISLCMAGFPAYSLSYLQGYYWLPMLFVNAFIAFLALAYAKKLAVMQRRYQQMSHKMANLVEDERRRFARDLHDGLGQYLALLNVRLQKRQAQEPDTSLETEVALAQDSVREMRRAINDQRPLSLEVSQNFSEAMREEINRLNQVSTAETDLVLPAEAIELPQEAAQHLFRIVQEAVNNAIKHGQSSHIRVVFSVAEGDLSLLVEDNGIGKPGQNSRSGHGSINLRDRARLLNAHLYIEHHADKGSSLHLNMRYPLSN